MYMYNRGYVYCVHSQVLVLSRIYRAGDEATSYLAPVSSSNTCPFSPLAPSTKCSLCIVYVQYTVQDECSDLDFYHTEPGAIYHT